MRHTRLTTMIAAAVLAAATVVPSVTFAADADPAGAPAAQPAPASSPSRVLVLPFAPLADAERDGWIGRAISESITADLAVDRALNVSTNKEFPADTLADAIDAGRVAGVDTVIFGTFQRTDGEIRVTGQIADVAKGQAVAGLKATGPLRELFSLQDTLVHQIQRRLGRPAMPGSAPAATAVAPRPLADTNEDGVLGVPQPPEQRGIAWLDDKGVNDQLARAAQVGHDQFVFNDPFPVYNAFSGYAYGYGSNWAWSVAYGYPYRPYYYRPNRYPNYYGGYYPTVTATVTYSDGDGWNGRAQTEGYGMVGGGMRATPKYQPYQGVTPPRIPQRSNTPTEARTMQVGNRRMSYPNAPQTHIAPASRPPTVVTPSVPVQQSSGERPVPARSNAPSQGSAKR